MRSYNPGSKNANMIAIKLSCDSHSLEVFFSYDYPIAYKDSRSSTCWVNGAFKSATTSKHVAIVKRENEKHRTFWSEPDFLETLERSLNELQ